MTSMIMNQRILPNRDLWKRIKAAEKDKKKRILWKRAEADVIAQEKYEAKKAKETKAAYLKHRLLQSKINETIQFFGKFGILKKNKLTNVSCLCNYFNY